ncbi:hypothetical protein ACFFTN_01460 [Aminobacter aganoensis]|uniref:Uncharacterized protein n=1 Tax=Aminobacter aganoensis TaxID=83264 RepID=A0A7X0KJW1_9HYPH|nr:hypothetical protein [Aminobacter aganoensis]MBB6353473.1 hypothetical protein [Aminobacter aganoensis]
MSQQTTTFLLRGGLNLVTPPLAIPAGQCIAAINYEPDVAGYTRHGGYERFDGRPRPSDSSDPVEIAARRAAIQAVPGTGPVRGVYVFAGNIYAFRDSIDGAGKMHRDTSAGWQEVTFGQIVDFTAGTAEFFEGEVLVGGTSTATGTIERVVMSSGAWDGTATGFLVLSNVNGTFQTETVTSDSGSATGSPNYAVVISSGGKYSFVVHNFYGAARQPALYFSNGQGTAFEWTGDSLSPIRTGTQAGILEDTINVLERDGDRILTRGGDVVIMRAQFDRPTHIAQYKNHLFLGFLSGSVLFSSIGEPLQYITTTGAGEFTFGDATTGMLSAAAASLVIFGQNRIEYVAGNDASDFQMLPISDSSGGAEGSIQMMDRPFFLDDAGVRDLGSTAAYGDWRAGTLTQLIEPLIRAKRDAGVRAAASMRVKAKDQYKLFFDDGTGVTVYIGRKAPETLPFNLPITAFCACSGEVSAGAGDRLFVGSTDGYVYELNRGLSFDGAAIQAYVRLPFNSIGSPTQRKVFKKFSVDIDTPDDITLGHTFDIDYARGLGGSTAGQSIDAGSPIITTGLYDAIDWTQATEGRFEAHIDGFGENFAATLVSEESDKRQHTLSSATINFAMRGLVR